MSSLCGYPVEPSQVLSRKPADSTTNVLSASQWPIAYPYHVGSASLGRDRPLVQIVRYSCSCSKNCMTRPATFTNSNGVFKNITRGKPIGSHCKIGSLPPGARIGP